MSVDTKTKGRNLRPYRTLRSGALQVLITADLTSMAEVLQVDAGGVMGRRFRIDFDEPRGNCAI